MKLTLTNTIPRPRGRVNRLVPGMTKTATKPVPVTEVAIRIKNAGLDDPLGTFQACFLTGFLIAPKFETNAKSNDTIRPGDKEQSDA